MLDSFNNPPPDYRVTPIWVWDSEPDKREVERQVREMHAQGVGGFFIHADSDLTLQRDGRAWAQCIKHARRVARKLGMHVHVHDDISVAPQDPQQPVLAADLARCLQDDPWHSTSTSHDSLLGCRYKLISSVAHTAGRTRALADLLASRGWATSLEQLKRTADWQASLGINLFCPNAFRYAAAGQRKACVPSSQFYQATWWPHYRLFADYAARLGYMLSQGKHRAQVAILCPTNELPSDRSRGHQRPAAEQAYQCLHLYCNCLLQEHIDYDILSEESVIRTASIDQRLVLQGEHYELLILPPMTAIGHETAVKIREFCQDGGKLIGSALLPVEDSGGTRHEGVRQLFSDVFGKDPQDLQHGSEAWRTATFNLEGNALLLQGDQPSDLVVALSANIRTLIRPEVSIRRGGTECHDVTFLHCAVGDEDVFFFSNHAGQPREAQISIRCNGAPHMLNPETGEITALPNCTQKGSRTVLLHRFERFGSLLLAFNDEPALAVARPLVEDGLDIILAEEWEFEPQQGNSLILHDWTLDIPGHGTDKHVYTASFACTFKPADLVLVLEEHAKPETKRGIANVDLSVFVNGKQAPKTTKHVANAGFQSFEIGPLVTRGQNGIRVEATHTGGAIHIPPAPAGPRLVGSFSLGQAREELQPPRSRIRSGSWTEQGYPYYSGTCLYRQTVEIPPFLRGQRVVIRADQPGDLVEFVVNGASAGVRAWAPYQVDITALVEPGPNLVEIKVTNSLANALFSEARPSGLLAGARIIIS